MGFDPVSYLLGKQAGGGGGITPADNGKVVVDGALVSQTARTVTENGTFDTTTNNSVTVAVPLNVGITETISNLGSRYLNAVFSPAVNKLTVHNTNPHAVSANNFCGGLTGVSELDITVDAGITSLTYAFASCKAQHITINADTSACTSFNSAFSGNDESLSVTVDGEALNLSSAIGTNVLNDMLAQTMKEIRFVPNTAKVSWRINQCANISDATLVSIANALDGTATGLTLTIHATPKARCQTLMGTVADGVFTIDAGGSTTLADFITAVKGWTLA